MRHATNAGTYSQFRGEVQRFLNYIWIVRQKSLREIGGDDVDGYMEFVKNRPPAGAHRKAPMNKKAMGVSADMSPETVPGRPTQSGVRFTMPEPGARLRQ